MKKQRGEADPSVIAVLGLITLTGTVTALYGYGKGWDAGVRAAVSGKATVIQKPDGTSEAVKVKTKEDQ